MLSRRLKTNVDQEKRIDIMYTSEIYINVT